ncbi:oncoprotein-induced transcript 3 protein-like [Rhinoraja longicauda]
MIVCAPRMLVANLPDDRLQLNDASCNVTGNSTHLLLIIPLLGCGTVLLEDKSHYIFTNKIFSRSRDKISEQPNWVMVPLMCKFLRSTNASEEAKVQKSTLDKVFRVDSFEIQFSKEFNSSWWAAGPDSPFNTTTKDHLYISIVANSNKSSCSLHVESCQISEQHNSSAGVTLFKHGDSCLRYSAVEEHQTENQKERVYSVKLSSLPWHTAQVFVTCSVLLCAHAPSPYPCTQGCVPGTAPWTVQLALQQVRAGPVHITKEIDLGANYAVITVGLSLAGAVVYIVLILLKRSFVGLYYRGDVRSSRSRRF